MRTLSSKGKKAFHGTRELGGKGLRSAWRESRDSKVDSPSAFSS